MCGIVGFLSGDRSLGDVELRRMNATIHRRGPDGDGYFIEGEVGLAMRRLAIIDIDGGAQPVYNNDRSVVAVFNGEIYNYRSLRDRLLRDGYKFRTNSDSEVIAHLYEEHGDAFPRYLEGMFAIALWDARRKRLMLVRDRLGIKPLYIAHTPDGGIVFGSEIKAVLASGKVSRAIDWNAVDQYFAYNYIPAPLSIYRDVRKLQAGHQLLIELEGNVKQRRYWALPPASENSRSFKEIEAEVETSLLEAVESHMVSDVPVGAFLSGGVDSSLIVAMMSRYSASRIQTFTIGFAQSGAFLDERRYARQMVDRYHLDHTEISVSPDVSAVLPEIVDAFDEPFADDSVIPTYYVCQAAAQSVKVAMTGLGGDELFGGYKRHLGIHVSAYYRALPSFLRSGVVAPLSRLLPEASGDIVDHVKRFARAGSGDAAAQYQDYQIVAPWLERQRLYLPAVRKRIDEQLTMRVMDVPFNDADVSSTLEKALRTDLSVYLPDDVLTLTDRLSMWHSLELRVPFLHTPLVELAASLPDSAKIRGTNQKRALRAVARRWVPESILNHRKQGFEAPMGAWLKGPLLPVLDALIGSGELESVGIFDMEYVMRLRNDHVAGIRKNSKILFATLVFAQWASKNHVVLS